MEPLAAPQPAVAASGGVRAHLRSTMAMPSLDAPAASGSLIGRPGSRPHRDYGRSWDLGLHQSQLVTPSLVGMTPADAKAALAPNDVSLAVPARTSASTSPGAILTDRSCSGNHDEAGRDRQCPHLGGSANGEGSEGRRLKTSEAEADLRAVGITTQASEEFSDSVAKGLVISSSPKSGTGVQVGSNVDLVVSGPTAGASSQRRRYGPQLGGGETSSRSDSRFPSAISCRS